MRKAWFPSLLASLLALAVVAVVLLGEIDDWRPSRSGDKPSVADIASDRASEKQDPPSSNATSAAVSERPRDASREGNAALYGTITAEAGEGIAGAEVRAVRADLLWAAIEESGADLRIDPAARSRRLAESVQGAIRSARSARTDESGAFELSGLGARSYRILARSAGHVPHRGRELILEDFERRREDFELAASAGIAGRVLEYTAPKTSGDSSG